MKPWIAGLLLVAAGPARAIVIPPVMAVHAVSAGPQGLTLRIPGCPVRKSDLTLAVEKSQDSAVLLVARKHPDQGCAVAGPTDITWTFEDLGLDPGQPFRLANPVVAEPAPR